MLTLDKPVNLRSLYASYLIELKKENNRIIVLDAETSNSTGSAKFKEYYPESFIECYIAEQNMISMATALGTVGYTPFVSTFGAFLSRAYDHIRMAQYASTTLNIVGTHCGVSIGEDGPSQMALDDIAFFRAMQNAEVYYPCDDISFKACLTLMNQHKTGIHYCRVTRGDLYRIYSQLDHNSYSFERGGSHIIYTTSDACDIAIIAAGVTLGESIEAAQQLAKEGYSQGIRVINIYGIKPLNVETLLHNIGDAKHILVVEDHVPQGGIFGAVCEAVAPHMSGITTIHSLGVTKIPRSGKPHELLAYEGIDADAIRKYINSI